MTTVKHQRLYKRMTWTIAVILLFQNNVIQVHPITANVEYPRYVLTSKMKRQSGQRGNDNNTEDIIIMATPSHFNLRRRVELNADLGSSTPNDGFIWRWDFNHRFTNNGHTSPTPPLPPYSSASSSGNNISNHTNDYNDPNGNGNNQNSGPNQQSNIPNSSSSSASTIDNSNNNNQNTNDNTSKQTNNNSSAPNQQQRHPPLILIVQDSTPGPDQEVLYVTSKVNRAYAKRWGFDYLQFTGIAVGGSHSWQGTYNKPFLLNKLMEARMRNSQLKDAICDDGDNNKDNNNNNKNGNNISLEYLNSKQSQEVSIYGTNSPDTGKIMNTNNATSTNNSITTTSSTSSSCSTQESSVQSYDIVMFLDSSAIIVELDYDILSLINQDKMIAKSLTKDATNNGDVMLWNLNHPQTQNVSDRWIEECYLNSASVMKNVLHKVQSEAILSDILLSGESSNSGPIVGGDGNVYSSTNTNNSNNNSSNQDDENSNNSNNNHDLHQIIDDIPFGMVDGLQGTLVKQDMSYNDYMIEVSDLRRVMPIVTGIADSVCYRFYPQCEIV